MMMHTHNRTLNNCKCGAQWVTLGKGSAMVLRHMNGCDCIQKGEDK